MIFSTMCFQMFPRSSEKLSRALLGEQPWASSTLYCFPLTRVPPYRFIFNTTGKYNYKSHIYDRFPSYANHHHQGNLGAGMPRCLSHRQSSPHPSTQVASPRYLSQVLLVDLLLNQPPNLPTQVASPGTSSRYSFSTRTTVLDGWWQCFLKLLLYFCPRSL